jgi:DNA-binding transcriptional MerR regulator
MSHYSIRDLEKLSGIKSHTIRIWEKRYKLIEPDRSKTNRRLYSDSDLRKLINVAVLTRNGIKISHIARLSLQELDDKVAVVLRENQKHDNYIDGLVMAMVELNEEVLSSVLLRAVIRNGFEETFESIVFPFLSRVGLMWQTGSVTPSQEHFVANFLRQKIISATDSLVVNRSAVQKRVLLFLPGNELHELGLLYYNYLIRKHGHVSLYLGQMLPVEALAEADKVWNSELLVTGTVSRFTDDTPANYVMRLSKMFPERKILVAGLLAGEAAVIKRENVFPVFNSSDLLRWLEE